MLGKSLPIKDLRSRIRLRRGVIMVFVLAILTLLALVGFVMISRTHGEARRVAMETDGGAMQSAMSGVVTSIQEILRKDIWQNNSAPTPTLSNVPLNGTTTLLPNRDEGNEPWDAPGIDDRWLASSMPYLTLQLDPALPGYGKPRLFQTGRTLPDPVVEDQVLTWPHVSYLGNDLTQSASTNAFTWGRNARSPAVSQPVRYSADNLSNVRVQQIPPPGFNNAMVTGSTTNVTISEARQIWSDASHLLSPFNPANTPPAGLVPQFPYFDTNADGQVDLYDADGDGVPDSPLSFWIPLDGRNPNSARRLYAAVRIVDHGAMLNVNTASSLRLPGGVTTALMFDESTPDLQRRGRRVGEMLLDDLVHPQDGAFGNDRTRNMVNHRSGADPIAWEYLIRSKLVGGAAALPPVAGSFVYRLYGLSDEASLRHRGMLVPYERRGDLSLDQYDTIDRALAGSLLWTRQVDSAGNYSGTIARWNRMSANIMGAASSYEGYDSAGGAGWRKLMTEDETSAVRRRMMTTVSHEVALPPRGVVLDASGDYAANLLPAASPWAPVRFIDLPNVYTSPDYSLMEWPIVGRTAYPTANENLRIQAIDLNMTYAGNAALAKRDFILYSAAAMYRALAGVSHYQGFRLTDDPATPFDESANRVWLAWQFALNLADYRDGDNEPTALEWPAGSGRYLIGIEQQPFFTEGYAYLIAGTGPQPGPQPFEDPNAEDKWFHAVELYVPPHYNISTTDLYIRTPGAQPNPGLLPLTTFTRVVGGSTPSLVGGTAGQYIVLCGGLTNKPATLVADSFYRNGLFRMAVDGSASVELVYAPGGNVNDPRSYVVDALSTAFAPGAALSSTPDPTTPSPWAYRLPSIAAGNHHAFSLRRSTKGWRFATGWHHASDQQQPAPFQLPGFEESLGRANSVNSLAFSGGLDVELPELPWPARVGIGTPGNLPTDGFALAQPYSVFDSPGELGRIMMLGPINRPTGTEPPYLPWTTWTAQQIPVTGVLGLITNTRGAGMEDLPSSIKARVAVGRPDFAPFPPNDGLPDEQLWARRLLNFFTCAGPMYDGINNDGVGPVDDALDGSGTLNRIAGRINLNTAPVSVLRVVPYMCLLPISAEYEHHAGPVADPYAAYTAQPAAFWDLASAIVSRREERLVPVRLLDPTPGPDQGLRVVAVAGKAAGPAPTQPPPGGAAFRNVAQILDLARTSPPMSDVYALGPGNNLMFRPDRYLLNPAVTLGQHKLPTSAEPALGPADVYSPDYRARQVGPNQYVADYVAPETGLFVEDSEIETAGIRARDAFLARWANVLTTRSDVFTAYIVLIDENGQYVLRGQVTLDRSECFREDPTRTPRIPVLPKILLHTVTSYTDDLR